MAVLIQDTSLPQAHATSAEARGDRYGDQFVRELDMDRIAEQGSLFRSGNATLGTGIAQTANTTEDTTKPFIFGLNGDTAIPTGTGKSVRLVRLVMRPTAVSSGQTIQNISVVVSVGGSRSSAGTDYKINVSGLNATVGYSNVGRVGANNNSILSALWVGAPVTVLGTNPRLAARFSPRTTTIPVVGDEYVMYFGTKTGSGGETSVINPVGTTINRYVKFCDPVIVDVGGSFMVIPWAAGIGGAMSWEYELVWAEY